MDELINEGIHVFDHFDKVAVILVEFSDEKYTFASSSKLFGTFIFLANFTSQGVLLLFGYMEIDLPTPVSQPPSQGTYLYSLDAKPQIKVCLRVCLRVFENGCFQA